MIQNFFLIYNNLSISFKKKSIYFILFLIITTFLEILGIGIVIPVIDLLTNLESQSKYEFDFFKSFIIFRNEDYFLTFALLFLITIYVLKSLFLIAFYFWRNKFIWDVYSNISSTILKNYINKELDFYFKNNSTELINNTYLESRNYTSCLNEYLKIISEGLILICIILFLLFYDFYSTISASLLIILSAILIKFSTRKKVKKLGEMRIKASIGQLKNLQQIFFSIKDIKLKSLQLNFLQKYNNTIDDYSKSAYISSTILELPKVLFEIIFVLSISVVIYILNLNNINDENIATKIGVFAIAAFRSFPSVIRIINSTQQISFLKPSIKKILPNLVEAKKMKLNFSNSINKIEFLREINIDKVTYTYPNKKIPTIKDFTMKIKRGDFIGIIGKSGRGKSTILDLIMGLIKPTNGRVLVDEKNIQNHINKWQNSLGYVSQTTNLLEESIKNNIAFGIPNDQIDYENLIKSSNDAQIFEFIESLPNKFETLVGERGITLSGGQIQRIGIARELYRNPSVILFDEATSALDTETENEFLKCLEKIKGKKTLIFVSHRKTALKYCDTIINLK